MGWIAVARCGRTFSIFVMARMMVGSIALISDTAAGTMEPLMEPSHVNSALSCALSCADVVVSQTIA